MNINCYYNSCSLIGVLSAIGTLFTGLGAILLAFWAIKKYFSERDNEARLSIEFSSTNYSINNSYYVYLDILLKNEGIVPLYTFKRFYKNNKGKIAAKEYTWKDSIETITFSAELQVKRIKQGQIVSFDWFDKNQYETIIDHLNLLKDLEDTDDPKHYSFFLDSKESYHLGCYVQLNKGLYEAKVIVVGDEKKLPDDFWHRRFPFEVK